MPVSLEQLIHAKFRHSKTDTSKKFCSTTVFLHVVFTVSDQWTLVIDIYDWSVKCFHRVTTTYYHTSPPENGVNQNFTIS
jgi:hypothetical protein